MIARGANLTLTDFTAASTTTATGDGGGGGDGRTGRWVLWVVLACFAKKKSAEVERESLGVTGG